MKKLHLVLLLSLTLVCSACYTSSYMSGKLLMSVQQGMTPNEVRSIFGTDPDFRRFDGGNEEWEYRRYSPAGNAGWSIVLIQFTDGRVSGMDSFKDRSLEMNLATVTTPSPTAVTTIEAFPNRQLTQDIQVMSNEEFDRFLSKVKFTVMSDEQKKLIGQALKRHDFTSDQTLQLMKEIFMSDDKVEMMMKMYPYVTDKRNFNKVVDLLSFSGDRDKVHKFIDEYHSKKR